MSGDLPATIENLFVCPFCGRATAKIGIDVQPRDFKAYFDGEEKYLIFRIECEDAFNDSVHRGCPAMDEGEAYFLHVFLDGHCHEYYY